MATVPTLTGNRIANRPDSQPFQDASTVVNSMRTVANSTAQIQGNLAQGLLNLSNEIEKNKINENERHAKEADVEFTRRRREILYGADDGSTEGFYHKKSRDAVQAAPAAKQAIQAIKDEIAGKLTNEKAREMFVLQADARINSEFTSLDKYTIGQQHNAQVQAADARIAEAIKDGVGAYDNTDRQLATLSIIKSEVVMLGELQGWDGEVITHQLERRTSLFYDSVVTAMLQNGESRKAREYLDSVEGIMDPIMFAAANDKVRTGEVLGEAQEAFDVIVSTAPGNLEAQIELSKSDEYSPEVRDLLISMINQASIIDEKIEKQNLQRIEGDARQHIGATGGDLVGYLVQNPDEAILLLREPGVMDRLQAIQKTIVEGIAHPHATDGSVHARLREMNAQDLAQETAAKYAGQLTPQEFKEVSGYIASAKNRMAELGQEGSGYKNAGRWARHFGEQLGIEWDAKDSKKDNARQYAFENELFSWVDEQTANNNGMPPTSAEIKEHANFLHREIQADTLSFGGFFGERAQQVIDIQNLERGEEGYETARVPGKVLGPVQRGAAIALFKRNNINDPSIDDIGDLWGASLTGNQARMDRILGRESDTSKPTPIPRKTSEASQTFADELAEARGVPPSASIATPPVAPVAPATPTPVTGEGLEPTTEAFGQSLEEQNRLRGLAARGQRPATTAAETTETQREAAERLFATDPSNEELTRFIQEQFVSTRTRGRGGIISSAVAAEAVSPIVPGGDVEQGQVNIADAGEQIDIPIDRKAFITENEGLRLTSYDDSEGVRTVGIGFNLERDDAKEKIEAFGLDFKKVVDGEQSLTKAQANQLFEETLAEAEADAEIIFSNFGELSDNRKTALIDMVFNLGGTKWRTYTLSIKDIANENWDAFVKRWEDSRWAKQVGSRADKVLQLIKEG